MSSIADSAQSTPSSSSARYESQCPSPASLADFLMPFPSAADDPAAIVGLACRVPGAQNPSQLWKLIEEKRDVQRKIPENRFNVDAFYHPDGTNKGTVSHLGPGMLESIPKSSLNLIHHHTSYLSISPPP